MSSADGRPANPMRGEASLLVDGHALLIRPSFAALVAAEVAREDALHPEAGHRVGRHG